VIPAHRSPRFLRVFDRYVTRHLGRRFDRMRLWESVGHLTIPRGQPLLFILSHASWWDVLVGYYLARLVVGVESYAPMDEAQLRRYRILSRLGIYSVDRFSMTGMRAFVRYTTDLLQGERAVWITPQGEIVSNWKRPVRFQTGVGHLVRRVEQLITIPVAIAYEFLEEPRPEIFVKFGPPRHWAAPDESPVEITRILEGDLERELDAMLAAVTERDIARFSVLLDGSAGPGLIYDRVRALRAWWSGRPDPRRHGDIVSDPRRFRERPWSRDADP
jgi:1-acyl-sn-glycerol-3-phosphate acyltransferase